MSATGKDEREQRSVFAPTLPVCSEFLATRKPPRTVRAASSVPRSEFSATCGCTCGARTPSFGFTLIELLVVIAIIGILVTLITGAVRSVVRDRKIAQAKSEVQAIAVAAEEYYRIYREIPIPTNRYDPSGGDYVLAPGTPGVLAQFYDILTGSNPQKKVFLTIERVEGVNSSSGVLLDPWKHSYDLYFDSNYNGVIDFAPYGGAGWYNRLRQECTVFVRCRGPDGLIGTYTRHQCDDETWPPLETLNLIGW